MKTYDKQNLGRLAVNIAVPLLVGAATALINKNGFDSYERLNQPPLSQLVIPHRMVNIVYFNGHFILPRFPKRDSIPEKSADNLYHSARHEFHLANPLFHFPRLFIVFYMARRTVGYGHCDGRHLLPNQ